jgi:hypothetical protein
VSYAVSHLVRAPSGIYYEIAASPRGDLLLFQAEDGIGSWLSTNTGTLGILSFLLNLIIYRRSWRIVVKRAPLSQRESPTRGILMRRDVKRSLVDHTIETLTKGIETGDLFFECN